MTVRASIHVHQGERLTPMPFVSEDNRAVAWLHVGEGYEGAIHGEPAALRELAAAAIKTADEAEELLRVAELVAAQRTTEPLAG